MDDCVDGRLTCVAEVDELLGEQVGEQLHDEEQVLVLVLLRSALPPPPAHVVLGVHLQQRQARLVEPHRLNLGRERILDLDQGERAS